MKKTAVRLVAAVAVVAAAVPAMSHGPVNATNVVTVTTIADIVADDGLTSLREAFDTANSDGDDTVIELVDTTYQLTDCVAKEPIDFGNGFFGAPAEDDANADGDLDHIASDDITINGNGATIQNTCLYDRVVHSTSSTARLVLDDVTITGGIGAPGEGSNIWAVGGATLNEVHVLDGRRDVGNQGAAVVVGESSGMNLGDLLLVTDSTVLGNEPSGIRVANGNGTVMGSTMNDNDGPGITVTFGTLQVTDSQFVDNNGHGVAGIDGAITITDSVMGNNNGYGARNTGNADSGQPLNVVDSNVISNTFGGLRCSYCTGLNVSGSTIFDNAGTGASMTTNVAGPTMTIERSEIVNNGGRSIDGSGVAAEAGGVELEVEDGHAPTALISRSTIAGNSAATGVEGGGVRLLDAGLAVDNSTITGNDSDHRGGGIASDGVLPITLEFVTLVENQSAIGGANLDRGAATLTSTATVIGLPLGSVNCVAGGLINSGGYNQADDNTCDFGGGPGDVAPAPAPMLEPLADNGGATPTRLPMSGSPLLGVVDGVTCQTANDDQRDTARPQGIACEVGAVEVDERPSAVIVAGRAKALKPDRVMRDWLLDRNFIVTFLDDDDLDAASIAGLDDADLVVVSSSVKPNKVGSMLVPVTAPILVSEGYLLDDFQMASESGETNAKTKNVVVVDPATGFTGYTSVYKKSHRLAFGVPGADANIIATAPSQGDVPVIFTYDEGDQLVGGAAPAGARGAFFFDYSGPNDTRPAARQLFDHVVDEIMS